MKQSVTGSRASGPPTKVAFSESVEAIQERRGSRASYAKLEARGGWESEITDELAAFIAQRDSFYLATASRAGQPYVQHRGGPPGFLRVLGPRTLGFADFSGNRQYITLGNLAENDRAFLFLMDYAQRRRVKIWGTARVIENDPELLQRLSDPQYDARLEQCIVFEVEAWDVNCPRHIPRLLHAQELESALSERIAQLEAENRELRARIRDAPRKP